MHAEYEVQLFMEPGHSYVVDGQEYPMGRCTFLLVPPNAYHFALIKESERYCRFLMNFRADAVAQGLLKQLGPDQVRCCQLHQAHPIVLAFERIRALLNLDLKEHRKLILQTFCNQILLELLASGQEKNAPRAADPVLDYIHRNLCTIRSVEDVAAALFISPSTLSHQFRQRMGISLMKYIRQKRLLMARHMLEQGGKPLEVYTQCGFSEYTTFYKAYVQYFGLSPSQ